MMFKCVLLIAVFFGLFSGCSDRSGVSCAIPGNRDVTKRGKSVQEIFDKQAQCFKSQKVDILKNSIRFKFFLILVG
ncbi:hypothetical protein B7994_11880 [Fibrobacter sp. UWR2]|nr:hypothetical protein B7994_11880 [Fibrobacter sp. UWR2]